jgi:hypothetical protein
LLNNEANSRKVKVEIANKNTIFSQYQAIGNADVIELHTYTNSTAYTYAKDNGIKMVLLNNSFQVNFQGTILETIGEGAFQNRNDITSLSIPANTGGSIDNNALLGCDKLNSIELPIKEGFNFVNLFGTVPTGLQTVNINSVYNVKEGQLYTSPHST